MIRKRAKLIAILAAMLAMPLLACNPNVLNTWGDLLGTARFIWTSMWTTPEPDYDAIGIVCTQELLAAYGEPPVAYVDNIRMTTGQITAAWGSCTNFSVNSRWISKAARRSGVGSVRHRAYGRWLASSV